MSLRTFDGAEAVPLAFDGGRLGRLTWLGLTIAAIGWMLLIGAALLADRLAEKAGITNARGIHTDLVEVARCMIGSGLALAIIGALQTGFGALNRFFSAVLNRSAPRPSAVPTPAPATDSMAQPMRERRPYQILADGSVEVETIVGTRRFCSMNEARDFI